MESLRKFHLDAKTQLLVQLYVKVTNHTLHVTRVFKCCHSLHVVTSSQRGTEDSIGKYHHVRFPPEVDLTSPKLTEEQRHNATGRLQAGANQGDVARHMEVCTINRLWLH